MLYRFLADAVVVIHLGFVLFVVAGGFLVLRWPRTAWVQLPAAAWGVLVEWSGWVCPLTPLENWLRLHGGVAGYAGGFVERYFLPVLYPASLPDKPIEPQPLKIMALALVAGLLLGAAGAVGREFLDRSVYDVRALQSEFDVPVLGEIPRIAA